MKKRKFIPPQPVTGDTAHLVTKAMLSPIWGASELFEYLVQSPLTRRTDEWMIIVSDAMNLLHQNFGFELENLQSNEKFVTIVIQATRVAAQSHQRDKLDSLKNAIIASAFQQNISDDLQMTFIRYVDELTPSHLLLLKFFIKFEAEIVKLKSYPALFDFYNLHFEHSNAWSRDEFKMLIGDLSIHGLVRISQDIDDFDDIYEASSLLTEDANDSLPRILITHIAQDFIRFISETDLPKSDAE